MMVRHFGSADAVGEVVRLQRPWMKYGELNKLDSGAKDDSRESVFFGPA